MNDAAFDVAIIGGGVAGTYCAWRLATDRSPGAEARKVCVFEQSGRIGGRLESVEPAGMPHLRAEVGGMRFLTTQRMISCLVDELQLVHRPFGMGDRARNLYYLRRRHLRGDDFLDPSRVPYLLDWNERGKHPVDLLLYAIETAIPHALEKTPAEWAALKRSFTIDGRHLYNIGFWNLLYKILSSEAYNLVLDALGYFSIVSNWNAGEALQWFLDDFPPDAQYRTLVEGMQGLPLTLARRFKEADELRFTVRTGHRLVKVSPVRGTKAVKLVFEVNGDPKRREEVTAAAVILALPKRALEILGKDDAGNPRWKDKDFLQNLNSVTAQPAYKLFLGYEYPWWRVLGLESGRSGTDLPIRQTYYFGTECEQDGADKRNHNSLLMASYNDGMAVGFWDGFKEDPREEGKKNRDRQIKFFVGRRNPFVPWPPRPSKRYRVTEDLVEQAHYQLKRMHAIELFIPKPYTAIFKDWRRDPFGGGWHFWNVDVRPWDVMSYMRKPFDDLDLFICGEAYSCNQGWVEGALKSAEQLLQKTFGLAAPGWLPPGYDIGP